MKYLHEDAPGVYHLDHRLTPGVRAMFAAMSSRLPSGGIAARYTGIVDAVAEGIYEELRAEYPHRRRRALDYSLPWEEMVNKHRTSPLMGDPSPPRKGYWMRWHNMAEDRLCEYPLHPKVQGFFNKFVLNYGHSSIMELTGNPAVYTEGISWYTAYLLFDDPLCAGQEFSTRAVRHKNWPMARECYVMVEGLYGSKEPEYVGTMPLRQELTVGEGPSGGAADTKLEKVSFLAPHSALQEIHDGWFKVFQAEVNWWKEHLSDAANRKALGIADKEPFRPALDRARWSIPGTISTGCCHTGHLRGRARILRDGLLLAQRSKGAAAIQVWENIQEGYKQALPGLAEMGLREAVYSDDSAIPSHLLIGEATPGPEVEVRFWQTSDTLPKGIRGREFGVRSYLDPKFNQLGRADFAVRCSLAVARDWHRHRPLYPWSMDVVRGPDGLIKIHSGYEPKSVMANQQLLFLRRVTTKTFDEFMAKGDQMRAMLCLPLGTEVLLSGQGGLRDVVYMLELRAYAEGANFEYKAQALTALGLLALQLSRVPFVNYRADIRQLMGLMPSLPNLGPQADSPNRKST